MDVNFKYRFPNGSGLVGSVISVALVFAGASGRAEGITGFGSDNLAASGLMGEFSTADLEQLEHATSMQATAARLAALGADIPGSPASKPRAASPTETKIDAEPEVFQYTGRIAPLLVARPETATAAVVPARVTLRPGLVQPVGVPAALLRSPTPTERASR